jgi:hypothetical protein
LTLKNIEFFVIIVIWLLDGEEPALIRGSRKIIRDYTDPKTGVRCIEDDRGERHYFMPSGQGVTGEIHVHIPEIKVPPAQVHVDITPPVDDPEKQRLIRIMEALRAENNWLWNSIMTAIVDRKKKGAPTAMDELETKIKERQRA